MNWSAHALNAIREIGHGISAAERVKLVAALLRTLTSEEQQQAATAAYEQEPDVHVRKAFARLKRTDGEL